MEFIILTLIIAGIAKAWTDSLVDEDVKKLDWQNKYDLTKPNTYNHWWYLGFYQPKYVEKFPFSSTALVFLTDRWHMSQFIMLRCFYLAISISMTDNIFCILILVFIAFPIILGIAFESFYNRFRKYYNNLKK